MTKGQQLIISKDKISLLNNPKRYVMMDWERPLMKRHAEVVSQNGGHILEIGFGLGISAGYIQQQNIQSHTIIEVHDDIYQLLLEWSKDKPNVIPIKGDWYELSENLELDKYDGIFYDADCINSRKIKNFILKHIKPNGIFSYFNLKKIDIHNFGNQLNQESVEVNPDNDCSYCGSNPTSLKEAWCHWVIIKK
jgi:hypothetical protein